MNEPVPSTPNSELLLMLREVAESEALPALKFKIVEKGGRTVKRKVQIANPRASGSCQAGDCVACRGEGELAGHAGSLMCCMSLPVRCAQRRDRQYTWVRLPVTCTPGAGSMQPTIRRRMENRLWPNINETDTLELMQISKEE